jgi:hypothetical protein
MEEVTISVDLLVGLLIGIGLPILLWGFRMFAMTKQMRDMHLEPDEHDFGTVITNELLRKNLEVQAAHQREYINSNKALRYAFKELSHFMRWMVKENTGKEPPPYVRD